MQNNQNNSAIALNYFTQPETLQQIGPARLNRFLGQFANDLSAAGSLLPAPESENGNYLSAVGALFASTTLPLRLREALRLLEEAAAPENAARLDDAIQQHIPCVSINRQCPLDCALELWFLVPDALSQFQPEAVPEALPLPPGENCPKELSQGTPEPAIRGETAENSPSPWGEGRGEGELRLFQDGRVPGEGVRGNGCSGNSLSTINSATINHPALPSTLHSPFSTLHSVTPWPDPVNGKLLLDALVQVLKSFVVLPIWATETLALWILHTFAFQLREVSTYIGIESPEKQCGKTTLLTVLNELAHRAIAASNISPPAFFRVIEDLCPTLLIDEGDTFLNGNEQLRGILNAGYKKKTSFVLRAGPFTTDATVTAVPMQPSHASRITHQVSELQQSTNPVIHQSNPPSLHHSTTPSHSPLHPSSLDTRHSSLPSVTSFSCWCPKCIATIGRLPDTLADRCIVIRMQRKTRHEKCERLRHLDAEPLKQQCARFVLDHQQQIATARPELPPSLSDRAADIWEPLLALADLAGGDWPQKAREAAVSLSAVAQDSNPIGSLLMDIFIVFASTSEERLFTKTLLQRLLSNCADRPWAELRQGKPITELWLWQKLRPYGIYPRTMRIGEARAKGYFLEDFKETFQRYLPKSELLALIAESKLAESDSDPKNSGP